MNYDELLAPAAKAMRPSGIRKFFDLAADMPHCISLGVGEPDFKTPWSVRDAGIRSLELGRTKYTANSGLKELRGEICNYLQRRFDLHYKEENVLVTVGGSEAIDLTIRAVVQPGDEVIIPEPCFVCYEPITQLTGGVPVHIATRAEDQFRLTADQLRAAITPRTKLLIFPYPNNPTGAVMSAAEMEEIAAVLRETNVLVLSDEIYSELTYGLDRHVSIASLPGMAERTIVVNGFSKSYAMTGWRLGYAAGPAPLVKVMTKIHQSCIMSAPTTSQYAAITALRQCDDQIEMMRDEYNRRRRYVVKALNEMGLTCFEPRGAFYVFPSIQISGLTSSEFCEQLLREKEVAIIPGSAFGASGEGYARISYAYSVDHLQTAMKRIREFLTEHGWIKSKNRSDPYAIPLGNGAGPGQAKPVAGRCGHAAQRLP
ncbi:pyridoxal phosphate-dependent aminotransferase [Gemmiger formicilis]|uniref:pyridoxal phosphate-dependent aminotransferase n=1 Tax=Gemmiger formicilis TaxID=745368 RepID=UPI00399A1506